jgi:hypothetical protein
LGGASTKRGVALPVGVVGRDEVQEEIADENDED